jgi:hypothetical protein
MIRRISAAKLRVVALTTPQREQATGRLAGHLQP